MILLWSQRLLKTSLFKYGVCSGFTYVLFIASPSLLHYLLGWTIFFSVALAHVIEFLLKCSHQNTNTSDCFLFELVSFCLLRLNLSK